MALTATTTPTILVTSTATISYSRFITTPELSVTVFTTSTAPGTTTAPTSSVPKSLYSLLPGPEPIPHNLTTIFTPPAACFAPTYTLSPAGNDQMNGTKAASRGLESSCYPDNFYLFTPALTTTDGATYVRQSIGYYMPGICPAEYVTAVQSTISDGSTTMVTCCPSGFNIIETTDCYRYPGGIVTVVDGSETSTVSVSSLIASSIVVAWRTGDVSLFSTATASPGSSVGGATPTSTSAAQSGHDRSLSTGAKVGIAVGAVVGVVVILATSLLWFRWWFVKRRARKTELGFAAAELAGEGTAVQELEGDTAREMSGVPKLPEADSEVRAELEGDWAGWEVSATRRFSWEGQGYKSYS